MFTVELKGAEEVAVRLDEMPAVLFALLQQKIAAATIKVQGHIVADKLSGQVLGVRSGALRRSIQQETESSGQEVTGRVFSSGDVKYAAIHEFGGQTAPHDILPTKAKALAFTIGGRQVFARIVHHPGSAMPERSFMRSGLADLAPEIISDIRAAIVGRAQLLEAAE